MKWVLFGLGFLIALQLISLVLRKIAGSRSGLRIPGLGLAGVRKLADGILADLKSIAEDGGKGVPSIAVCDNLLERTRSLDRRLEQLRRVGGGPVVREYVGRCVEAQQNLLGQLNAIRERLSETEILLPYYREFGEASDAEPDADTLSRFSALRGELENVRSRIRGKESVETVDQLLEKAAAAVAQLESEEGRKEWIKQRELMKVARLREHLREISDGRPSFRMLDQFRAARHQISGWQATFRSPEAREAIRQLSDSADAALRRLESPEVVAAMRAEEMQTESVPALARQRAANMSQQPGASEEDASRILAFAEFVIAQYGWALNPPQLHQWEEIAAKLRGLKGGPGGPENERVSALLGQAIDQLHEHVRALISIRVAIQDQVLTKDEALAGQLTRRLDNIEQACRAGTVAGDGELKRFIDEISRVLTAGPASSVTGRDEELPSTSSNDTLRIGGQEPAHRSSEMPTALTDRVHFSVTAPQTVVPGAAFVLDVWAHLEQQRAEVLERARQHVGGGPIFLQEKGPVRIARGTILAVRVQVEGMVIQDPEDTILWEGEIGKASFPVQVPKDARPGPCAGIARFYVDAFEVAKLHFALTVGKAIADPETLPAQMNRYRSAFASYASEDNDEVLSILQGIKMGMPDLDIFYAEASLRAGERWPDRLKQEILARDVFYLFWSRAASVSPWVDMEWRFAYEKRGIDIIKPVPLAPPQAVPPPPELAAELHFNDWVLAHKRQIAGAYSRSSPTG